MRILHITSHLGGGVGTVIMDWMNKVYGKHEIVVLDGEIKEKRGREWITFKSRTHPVLIAGATLDYKERIDSLIHETDIVLVHYWNHPMLTKLFSRPIPDCRLVFWLHKNFPVTPREIAFPDVFMDTSPIQGHGQYIWSTGDMGRFFNIKPEPHIGFNLLTVASKKLHPDFMAICLDIKEQIPDAVFTVLGDLGDLEYQNKIGNDMHLVGKVDDITLYLTKADVFLYPLRPDHYGTAEQVIGESMAVGIVPVVMGNLAEMTITRHGENGLVATTEMDYVEQVKYLFNHSVRRRALSHNARIDAKNIYNIDTMISQWNAIFESMMSQPKRNHGVLT